MDPESITPKRTSSISGAKRVSRGVGGALVELPETERGGWSNPIEFVLSCIGYAVGIGNVWRFPYLVYRNGGGAFLVPFILMLITMGLPLFFLELAVGQYTGLGPNEAFARMAPAFQGLGYCTLVVIGLVIVYYMVIIAWTLFYIFASFSPNLAWAHCDNYFNTDDCYSGIQNQECQNQNNMTIFYKRTCTAIDEVCRKFDYNFGNTTHCMKGNGEAIAHRFLYKRVLSSEEYFKSNGRVINCAQVMCEKIKKIIKNRRTKPSNPVPGMIVDRAYSEYVLGIRGATWENFGGIRWELLGCLTLAWAMCYFCLIKGVQSIGKIVYFTALFPYVVLLAFLIRGVTLEGAGEGSLWYITPTWSTLKDANVWGDAASQIFYSLGIGCGSLVTLSSYNSFTNNCHRDAIFVGITNLFTSIFAGFVIFSILGFLAKQMQMPIEEVVQSGTGLAFIACPEAVVRMPLPNLWALLFFVMLLTLGLGSQFAGVQAISAAILDVRPDLRKYESYVILAICIFCWLMGIPMIFDGGIYLFTLMDWNTASWAVLLIGFAELVLPSWFYGCNKFLRNIGEMQMKFGRLLYGYWWLSWVVLAPITCLGVFVYQMYTYESAKYGEYVFPGWANTIGILIGVSTIAPFPIFFSVHLWKLLRDSDLFRPTESWGPASIKRDNLDGNSIGETVPSNPDKSVMNDLTNGSINFH